MSLLPAIASKDPSNPWSGVWCVGGAVYWNAREERVHESLYVGAELHLRAESDNPHDPLAIEILLDDAKFGYVPRSCNCLLSELLHDGIALHCTVGPSTRLALSGKLSASMAPHRHDCPWRCHRLAPPPTPSPHEQPNL